jgi:hypothetical protein
VKVAWRLVRYLEIVGRKAMAEAATAVVPPIVSAPVVRTYLRFPTARVDFLGAWVS